MVSNSDTFCHELTGQVHAINNTLRSLKAKCEKQACREASTLPIDSRSAMLRAAVGDSVADQIGFYQRCMQIWTGMSAMQQQQFIDAMATAVQRWRMWTPSEQETFLSLFSRASEETRGA